MTATESTCDPSAVRHWARQQRIKGEQTRAWCHIIITRHWLFFLTTMACVSISLFLSEVDYTSSSPQQLPWYESSHNLRFGLWKMYIRSTVLATLVAYSMAFVPASKLHPTTQLQMASEPSMDDRRSFVTKVSATFRNCWIINDTKRSANYIFLASLDMPQSQP